MNLNMKEVVYFEGNGICLCLNHAKKWVLRHGDNIYSLESNDSVLSLLPVLEIDYDDFVQKIQEVEISEDFYQIFPMVRLLKFPFDHERVAWAELAMNWIEKDSSSEILK